MLASEIIQQLNEASVHYRFPSLNVYFPVATRLSVYRDDTDWAIVMEIFEFDQTNIGHDGIHIEIYCFGNNLPQAPGLVNPPLFVTNDGPGGPLFDLDDIMRQLVSSSAVDMTIRGKVVPVTTDPARYAEAGIVLKQPPRILGYELLRLIASAHRHLLFGTEAEIAERIGMEMPLLLRLREWRHPDSISEMPGMGETFHLIAEVIATNNPSLYQPTEPPNTHWSNYPIAGVI